jgi:hyperosmotically inducible periplasmic protein
MGPGVQSLYVMKLLQFPIANALVLGVLMGAAWVIPVDAQSAASQPKADNTAVNKRDRNANSSTADTQNISGPDLDVIAKIRRMVMAEKDFSTYAHNVKIMSKDGTVTLKGPVRTEAEVQSILSKAAEVTGSKDKVVNEMTVEPATK